MKVHYITCAKSSSVDGQTNQLSLFHVMDEISGPTFPLHLSSFCVASLFEREDDDDIRSSFVLGIALDGVLLASFTMGVDFSKSRRNRSVNTIQGLTIPDTGLVTISLLQKSKVLAEWHALAVRTGDRGVDPKPAAKPAAAEPKVLTPKTGLALN